MRTYLTALALTLSAFCTTFSVAQDPKSRSSSQEDRSKKILKALRSKNPNVVRRALQEAATQKTKQGKLMKAVVDLLLSAPDLKGPFKRVPSREGSIALAAHADQALPLLLPHLRKTDTNSELFDDLLFCLARMGSQAEEALPILNEKMKTADKARKIRICLLMSEIGSNESEVLETARNISAFSSKDLILMATMRKFQWIDDEVIKTLTAQLKEESDKSFDSALALGAIGKRAASSAEALKKRMRSIIERDSYNAAHISYAVALGRVQPTERQDALEQMCRHLGEYGFQSRSDNWAMMWTAWTGVDADTITSMITILKDGDSELTPGASYFLGVIGYRARDAGPTLLAMLKKRKGLPLDPAGPLVLVADPSLTSKVESVVGALPREYLIDDPEKFLRILRLEGD